MNVDLSGIKSGKTVAVAVSGGSDSMALLHFLSTNAEKLKIKVKALNIEHGIRGESSKKDSEFVANYCKKKKIPLIFYSVDAIEYSKKNKFSIEHGARELRYKCFFDAIAKKECDYVATAHHLRDNAESVLINAFRGTGIKGLTGINDYSDKIVRPFINVEKEEIEKYIKLHKIPFVTDESNLDENLTRNYIRIKVLPLIKKAFPEVEKSLFRLSAIAKEDDEYIEKTAQKKVKLKDGIAEIKLPIEKALFSRAVISALKYLGIERDWEKTHIDKIYGLLDKENGKKIILPKSVVAFREYDKIVLGKQTEKSQKPVPYKRGTLIFNDNLLRIEKVTTPVDLKSGLFIDEDKLPQNAVIRLREDGDTFTKFGGGTKSLGDFLTDKKIPVRERDDIAVIANGKEIYAIFGIAVSDKTKVDAKTEKIIKITKE